MIDGVAFDAVRAAQDQTYWAASAALAAWLIGFLGLAANIVGLMAIWRQLKSNQAALEHSAEATKMSVLANRPWLKVRVLGLNLTDLTPPRVQVRISIENVGSTPAINVRASFRPSPGTRDTDIAALIEQRPPVTSVVGTVFPNDGENRKLTARAPDERPELLGSSWLVLVTYRMAGASHAFRTSELFFISARDSNSPEKGAALEFAGWTPEAVHPT